ncbi:MAG: DUF5110 domain-containing protein [Ardenticatenales bacterium]|nr:DUF5110 domain-containing protein [Ardenticatenales bacterium]
MRGSRRTPRYLLPGLLLLATLASFRLARAQAPEVQRVKYTADGSYLLVEFLADDLVHFEAAAGDGPAISAPIATSPMVAETEFAGPSQFADDGAGTLTTTDLRVAVDPDTLCATVHDLTRTPELLLTTICPEDLAEAKKRLTLDPAGTQNLYGLGEKFREPGQPDGDWVGADREIGLFGNVMEPFSGGAVGNAQFPVLYALGAGFDNYALFVDVVYKQDWAFQGDEWTMTSRADPLRWYLLSGPNLPDLRADYLALTGRPPVPPRALFGLWVSEYGYDNWDELYDKRASLVNNQFPQDGFVLDLQWFGGIQPPSQMGSLTWDETNFPDPAAVIAQLQAEEGLGLILIEESYVDDALSIFGLLASQRYLVKGCADCGPAELRGWWGNGGMVDWTNSAGAAFWHDTLRQPLIDMGVTGHWTDLGEPEMVAPNSWYAGLPGLELHDQLANHNIYNLLWAASIADGYSRNAVEGRPAILSRSGTSGIQRYGAAMWSADIGSNFASLATHMNAQMHVALSGIDYFGSDIGGFHRGDISGAELDELYTVWFANSALLDVPVRPHTENLCNCKETAPDRVGDLESNRANIRLRYALGPYLYSLAHDAFLNGSAVVPPLVYYFQDDPAARELGSHKMLGPYLLVRTVTEPGLASVPVYLPAGTWVNYHSGAWVESAGGWLDGVSTHPEGPFQLPLFLRAGAIVPQMYVDEQTMNLAGRRHDGSVRDELIVRIVPAPEPSQFILREDDGRTIAYQAGAVRQTAISQLWTEGLIEINIGAATGDFAGAAASRDNIIQVDIGALEPATITLNGQQLPYLDDEAAWAAAEAGWYLTATQLQLKTGAMPVTTAKTIAIELLEGDADVTTSIATVPAAAEPAPTPAPAAVDEAAIPAGRYLLYTLLALLILIGVALYARRRMVET